MFTFPEISSSSAYRKTDILKNLYFREPKNVVVSKRVRNKIRPSSKMFQHLVLSGGANVGFAFAGVVGTLIRSNVLNVDNIKTIHGVSIGAFSAFFFTIGYPFEDLEKYLIERPWKDLYKLDLPSVVRAVHNGGMYDRDTVVKSIKPLLQGKDLSIDITLEEYYEYCGKEIHMYATEYSELKIVDISHKTHPHWKLVDAIYASSCLPVLFEPFFHEGRYYIDGAVLMNYPLKPCLDLDCDPDTILGIYHNTNKEVKEIRIASPFLNTPTGYKLFEYIMSISLKMWTKVKHEKTDEERKVKHQISILCPTDPMSIFKAFESRQERERLYDLGCEAVKQLDKK